MQDENDREVVWVRVGQFRKKLKKYLHLTPLIYRLLWLPALQSLQGAKRR